jgi:hypothetical protein
MRKGLINARLNNLWADVQVKVHSQADFYRGLRQMKERRILIARQMAVLASMVEAAASKASTLPALVDNIDAKTTPHKKVVNDLYASIDETVSSGQASAKSVSGAAEEISAFAKRRIYFPEGA